MKAGSFWKHAMPTSFSSVSGLGRVQNAHSRLASVTVPLRLAISARYFAGFASLVSGSTVRSHSAGSAWTAMRSPRDVRCAARYWCRRAVRAPHDSVVRGGTLGEADVAPRQSW